MFSVQNGFPHFLIFSIQRGEKLKFIDPWILTRSPLGRAGVQLLTNLNNKSHMSEESLNDNILKPNLTSFNMIDILFKYTWGCL